MLKSHFRSFNPLIRLKKRIEDEILIFFDQIEGFQTFPAGYMDSFWRRIRIWTRKTSKPSRKPKKSDLKMLKNVFFNPFTGLNILFERL